MPFPSVIDNSMRTEFVACPQKFRNKYIHNIRPNIPSVHLHAGKAFARGLEVARLAYYGADKDPEDAVAFGLKALAEEYGDFEPGDSSPKSLDRMSGALVSYFDTYPLSQDFLIPATMKNGKLAVEFTGVVPLPINHPDTDEPLLYSGRFDMLAVKDGVLFVEDDKTTSQLGPSWSKRWGLASQFTGYCWLAQQYGFPVAGAFIRGVSILKTTYGHAQVVIYRPQWQIDRWFEQLLRDINRMLVCWNTGVWDLNLSDSCSAFGGCDYMRLCSVQNPKPWIETEYRIEVYSPPGAENAPCIPA